jgi:deoxyribonuclease-4
VSSLPPLGAHESIAGGLHRALERGAEIYCDCLQIFVKNASQWRAKPLAEEAVDIWRQRWSDSPVGPVFAHASYLINLATDDPDNLEKSRRALADELDRCAQLGLDGLVLHPGAHLGAGEELGIDRVAASLATALAETPQEAPPVLLENTAGQGTLLGHRLEQLASIREVSGFASRIGFCLDTCHAFAAGYPLHTKDGLRSFLDRVDDLLGLASVGCFHLNDSRQPFDSRRDRHANLGDGEMGLDAFLRLIDVPQLSAKPMILETPIGDDHEGHRRDLERLRGSLE